MGIFDEDPRLHKNVGVVGDQPIFIDVGRFKRDERRKQPAIYQRDLVEITARLRSWLAVEKPELIECLDNLVTAND